MPAVSSQALPPTSPSSTTTSRSSACSSEDENSSLPEPEPGRSPALRVSIPTGRLGSRSPAEDRFRNTKLGTILETTEEAAMPSKRANVKNEKQYEALKDKGMSKERAARIANSPGASSRGGKKSHSSSSRSSSSSQGGTTAQKKAAGRKGGKAAAKKR